MIKAVLLDLDDTLLRMDSDFVSRYIGGVANVILNEHPSLIDSKDYDSFVRRAMRQATQAAITNLDPLCTTLEVFHESLALQLGLPVNALGAMADQFQSQGFKRMANLIEPVEGARALIDALLAQGLAVVIATNPLFGLDTVRARMQWGDLPTDAPYALVTTIEEMHFTKPNPHYYEEILARIGVEDDEALMVGDNGLNDMRPAAAAGLYTFWITGGPEATKLQNPNSIPAHGRGSLAKFAQLVNDGWLNDLASKPLVPHSPMQINPRILGNVAGLYSIVRSIDPSVWHMHPDPNEWSPLEVICHLRDSERETQRPRLERIAKEDDPFVSSPTSPLGPGMRDLSGEDPLSAFFSFWDERQQTMQFLDSLQPADWDRPARHSIFGPTTLLEMAHFTTRHDRLHITQLCQTGGRCVER